MTSDGVYNDTLELMRVLMQLRQEPIHAALSAIRHKASMLHLDVLLLVYYFARTCRGSVLEIGAYVGGATIAAAFGIRDAAVRRPLITIEPGGRVKHHRLATRNILRDLERNIRKHRVAEFVTLVKGHSFQADTVNAVQRHLGDSKIGLLIIDADDRVQRDLKCYAQHLADDCWIVIDDYFGPASNEKVASTKAQVDALVEAGSLVTLGFYGWGTWVGRRSGHASSWPMTR